jgi:thiol peroxidase
LERQDVVAMKGDPLAPESLQPRVGDRVPEFTPLNDDLQPVKLSDSAGKARLSLIVLSLDMSVCSLQTQTFNRGLTEHSSDARVYTIPADPVFAQGRFSQEHNTGKLPTLSDHRDFAFGQDDGLAIKELRFLARGVATIDKSDKTTHFQVVPEVTNERDYDAALVALKRAME